MDSLGDERVDDERPDVPIRSAVSIVIPVYNSEQSLPVLAERLAAVLDMFAATEVLLVDDGSSDGSWLVIKALANDHDWIRGISLSRNFGQHNALLAGVRAAQHGLIITMDDDLQHRPEDLPTLVDALTNDLDLVYGVSTIEEHSNWRNLSSRVAKGSMRLALGAETARHVSAFRVFRSSLRDAASQSNDPYISLDVLLSWATTRVGTVDVVMDQRPFGDSNYTFRRLARHAINMTTGYSTAPLRLVTYLGFASSIMGLAIFVYVVVRFFVDGGSIPGFPFLASIVSLFSGAQMFAIGILGEYLGRMHFRSMQRPQYVIRESTGGRST